MRVLVAYDASPDADRAIALVAGVPWPANSQIEVVSVREPLAMRAPMAPPQMLGDYRLDDMIAEHLKEKSSAVVQRLTDAGLKAEATIAAGRPATAVADATRDMSADLLIVGSRGLGGIASLVLGSVSAELVDNAVCPVLVARGSKIDRVLFATDGSASADLALKTIAEWSIFENTTMRVISVADFPRSWTAEIAPEYAHVLDTYPDGIDDPETHTVQIARSASERLRSAGRVADEVVRAGDPAAEIVKEATTWSADLVVVGTRGETGLKRLVLGSVARNVLVAQETPSVLIVRQA